MKELFRIDSEDLFPGCDLRSLVELLGNRGELEQLDREAVINELVVPLRSQTHHQRVIYRPDGQVVALSALAQADGGIVFTAHDVTLLHRESRQSRAAHKATVLALADLAEHRDTDTADHVLRVARLTHEVARALERTGQLEGERPEEFLAHIAMASILHDVGKVGIPDDLLRKPGPLTQEERLVMQRHSLIGVEIIERASSLAPDSGFLKIGAEIARSHHERFDGEGYPHGLAGDKIPLSARIVAVADVFDALTSERPYKQAWSEEAAIANITHNSGTQFDPAAVYAFTEVMKERSKTPLIVWGEAMSVNDPALDRDHRIIISLLNQMASEANRRDPLVLEFVLDELVGYTSSHFAKEESHMLRMGFRRAEAHRQIHARMTQKLMSIRAEFLAGRAMVGDNVLDFLSSWLRQHILTEDMQYADDGA